MTKSNLFLIVAFTSILILSPFVTDSIFADSSVTSVSENTEVPMGAIVVGTKSDKDTTVVGLSSDGKIRVEITTNNPVKGNTMLIGIIFRDSNGGTIKQNVNYDILAMQNDKEILLDLISHAKDGTGTHVTNILASDEPVNIKVTLLGFGTGDESQWSGPKGEVLMFNVVPEFGTIAMMILVISIMSIVIVSAKSKMSLKM
ncbi:MAG TPA: PEFG-CTERM sorting domain-containing protein [Nitrosarchaeum sp.]|nr:PEFG-CTERM sorting domain-containing protein [Nitrosarchaeum sp.]